MTTTTMVTTLSLEPLLRALHVSPSKEPEAPDVELGGGGGDPGPASLAYRLQRLWQERGDFNKLTAEALQREDEAEGGAAGGEDSVRESRHEAKEQDAGDVQEEDQDATSNGAAAVPQHMSPDELWELKSTILEGLGLARNDVTSALDLLQLLLGPLNALNPPVPEDALALPSGSLSTSTLTTPLPAPAESIHLTNTALALSTKARATTVTAAGVLQSASRRLERTTASSQAEWTDLLRLKRSGQWKVEARGAGAAPSGSNSSTNVQIDKLAKDLCVFCGIEEAKLPWRQLALVRLRDRDRDNECKGKGKERSDYRASEDEAHGVFALPERLEGRRRLAVSLKINRRPGQDNGEGGVRELRYVPSSHDDIAPDDMHSFLVQAQKEIFEEELFAELIHEARESLYDIQAARHSLEVASSRAFSLHFEMVPIDELQSRPALPTERQESDADAALPQLLSVVARLAMIRIYRTRRRDLRIPFRQHHEEGSKLSRSGAGKASSSAVSTILGTLLDLATYYNYTTSLERILLAVRDSVASLLLTDSASEIGSGASGQPSASAALVPPHLDFVRLCDPFDDIVASLAGGSSARLGGLATLFLANPDRSLDFTFSSPTSLVLHLPRQTLAIRGLDQLVAVLQQAVRAAVLKLCEDQLKSVTGTQGASAENGTWEVLPTESVTQEKSRALARKSSTDGRVVEFISVRPQVRVQRSPIAREDIECSIRLDVVHSRRSIDVIVRKTFESGPSLGPDAPVETLRAWLEARCNK